MKTDDLIEQLASGLEPMPTSYVARRILLGLGAGALVSGTVMFFWLGLREDMPLAMTTGMFWVKFGYTLALFVTLVAALARVARPGGSVGSLVLAIGAPFALIVLMAAYRLMDAVPEARSSLLMGHSAQVCPWRILILSLPILAGAVWALRGLAPTRLRLSGLVAGACAGALGAWVYAFACGENAAPFVAVFYTAGIAAAAALGTLAGARVLRW